MTLPELLKIYIYTKQSLALLMRRCSDELPSVIDDVILQAIYGNLRKPPGDLFCSYQQLSLTTSDGIELSGIWAPTNSLAKATALKLLFPTITAPFKLPQTEPIPPYLAVAYDAFKYKDVMELMKQYPGEVMRFGFFTSDIASETQLIAKTVEKFENKTVPTTYEEKIVIQLAKRDNDCILAFSELGPSYISPNVVQGEQECKIFFPEGYDIPEENIVTIKKKSKKKGKGSSKPAPAETHECADTVSTSTNEMPTDTIVESETEHCEGGEENVAEGELDEEGLVNEEKVNGDAKDDEEEEEEEEELITVVEEADKATSPIEKVITN